MVDQMRRPGPADAAEAGCNSKPGIIFKRSAPHNSHAAAMYLNHKGVQKSRPSRNQAQ